MFSSLEPGGACGNRVSEADNVMATDLVVVGWALLLHASPSLLPHFLSSQCCHKSVQKYNKINRISLFLKFKKTHSFINDNAF